MILQPEVWMKIARHEIGQAEIAGGADNPRILLYLQTINLPDDLTLHDEIAWCSAFVNWTMQEAGLDRTYSGAARSWLSYGELLSYPRFGCIVVVKRGQATWQGHVGFYAGPGLMLAGNQANAVTVAPYNERKVLGFRWPQLRTSNTREPRHT